MVPFLCALVAGPAIIFLHEVGHYAAGVCLGCGRKLHYAQVTGTMGVEEVTWELDFPQRSAGPLVNAGLAVAGFLWLRRLREHRCEAATTLRDWPLLWL